LAGEVWGIGFKTADTIAQAVGIPHDSPQRVQAGLQYTLSQAAPRTTGTASCRSRTCSTGGHRTVLGCLTGAVQASRILAQADNRG
jgi:Helix-hairpin-helix containing domain